MRHPHTMEVWRARTGDRCNCAWLTSLQAKQLAQALSLGAADGDFCLFLVIHPKLVGTFEPGNDFLDAIDIHEIAPVGAPEEIGIETVEQFLQRTAIRLPFHSIQP